MYGFDVYAYEDAYIWGRCIDLQFAISNQAQEAFILQNTYVTLRNIFYNMILLLHYLRNEVAILTLITVIDLQPSELISFSLKSKKAALIHENTFVQTFHFGFDATPPSHQFLEFSLVCTS